MATRIQLRRGTAAQWATANPVLFAGEPAVETDTGKVKVGDGDSSWSELPYILDVEDLAPVVRDLLVGEATDPDSDFAVAQRAAFAASETGEIADGAVAAIVGTGGTATRGELDALFVAGRVLDSDGEPIPTKKLTVKLTADGLDIEDLIIEDVA